MRTDENGDKMCPATNNRGNPCKYRAGWGVEGVEVGSEEASACKFHGGMGGAPERNFNAVRTGEGVSIPRWAEYVVEKGDDKLKEAFRRHYAYFIEQGADEQVAAQYAVNWSKAEYLNHELIKEDFERPMYHEGEYVDDVFDAKRDSSAIQNQRAVRLGRREDELSPHSQQSGGSEVIIKGDSFDANISHNRVASDDDDEDSEDTDE